MDFLELEAPIKARLEAGVGESVKVFTAPDLDGVAAGNRPAPAVDLLYRGYRPKDGNAAGGFAVIEQTWWTVIAVRNRRHVASGNAARAEAGPIAGAVIKSLLGWAPTGAKAMAIAPAPQAGYDAGYFYLPIAWTTQLNVRTDACASS
ncbi:hypothetical protein SR882_10285 [Guyparkeria halophila]|uniref:Uncharacterized protein n=1 Tax=Guyparkeria halophila TaxID=47960 RepID=A0ABZ0YVD0_9GAMM|nr:hypothetical protein [Guyparkeria halophila]WQH16138.1 hypothetical protein SR882_10285 [Guyparkeria halophila]